MRVLHVINTAEVGGGAQHLLHLIAALRPDVESHVIVGRDGPAREWLEKTGVPVTVLGSMRWLAPAHLVRWYRRLQPDLVHLHGSRAGVAGIVAARVTGARAVVYTAHAFSFKRRLPASLVPLAVAAERLICHHAAAVICLTEGDRAAAQRRQIPADKIVIIPNGIAIDRFLVQTSDGAEFGIAPGVPVVGMIARLVPDKDPVRFVELARRIVAVRPETRFLLIGDGPLRQTVVQRIAALGLEHAVVVTGFRRDTPELLAAMDVVVLTSRWEALPYVVLEAMAAGKPVVAPALPGLAEVVEDGQTGRLVPQGRFVELAGAAVLDLLQHPTRRTTMGRAGRARVMQRYTVERMALATAEVYAGVLAARAAAGTTLEIPRA